MMPLQAFLDATMAVVLLSIVLTFVVIFGFIWAFNQLDSGAEDATLDEFEETDNHA